MKAKIMKKDEQIAFKMLASVYPIEAYDLDKKEFIKFAKEKNPKITIKVIDKLINKLIERNKL